MADPSSRAALHAEVLVLGSGPGGYAAAFRAADLGKRVVLVERFPVLGGVCLHVGCIPSKTLLHFAGVIRDARELAEHGVAFGEPKLDPARIHARKAAVVGQLADGLAKLAKQRNVEVVTGTGRFVDPHRIGVEGARAPGTVTFDHAVVAVGSRSVQLPGLPDDPRILDSTGALALDAIPRRLLVVGGGIIGLELAAVFDAFGSEVTVVELTGSLLPGVDSDLVRPLARRIGSRYAGILLETRVTRIEPESAGLRVSFEGGQAPGPALFDRVLVAVGRRPNGDRIHAEKAGLRVDERGFLPVDASLRTNLPHVFAIGDVARAPLLAHKAAHEGHVAAEVIAGQKSAFDAVVPSVAYTDPEVAWTGLTETEARERGVAVEKAVFPWSASARALGMGRGEGLTKLLFAKDTKRLVGAGIVGRHAGDLVAEATLAIEMGADAEDLALTVHAHPTLSETLGFAAQVAAGTVTDLYAPRKRRS
jgi:dihydrolipoamide dehydrogenase